MDADDSDGAIARAIAERHWGRCDAVWRLGEGSNNVVYVAENAGAMLAIKLSKPHREWAAVAEYHKEAWCADAARAVGVRAPRVLEFGSFEGQSFAVQDFADGGMPSGAQTIRAWRDLGEMARRIHAIVVQGWGVTLGEAGVFSESWLTHLDYNIGSLNKDDTLLARDVLDAASSRRLRTALERLRRSDFRFGLCHGDLSLRNMLVDGGENPWLIDWGSAAAHVVPHYEINEILRGSKPSDEELAAFLEGYGISAAAYAAMMPDLLALAALREVDTLRWAIDRKPDEIETMSVKAKAAVARLE